METLCPFCHQRQSLSHDLHKKPVCCANCQRTFIANPLTGVGQGRGSHSPSGVAANTVGGPGHISTIEPTLPPAAIQPPTVTSGTHNVGQRNRRPDNNILIAAATTGGLVLVGLVVAAAFSLKDSSSASGTSGSPRTNAAAGETWPERVRVRMVGEDGRVETSFVVGLTDAWWSDYQSSGSQDGKKTFVVAYHYMNVGPRERAFSLGPCGLFSSDRVEIKTQEGHIFPGSEFSRGVFLQGISGQREDAARVGWLPMETRKIDEIGESAIVFEIPENEVPTELVTSGSLDLSFSLPKQSFRFRPYSNVFGFLSQHDNKTLPALIAVLQNQNVQTRSAGLDVLGKLGPDAQEAVPAIIALLQGDEQLAIREQAANTLGAIGPGAEAAIPALRNAVDGRSAGIRFGGAYHRALQTAAAEALAKIERQTPQTAR